MIHDRYWFLWYLIRSMTCGRIWTSTQGEVFCWRLSTTEIQLRYYTTFMYLWMTLHKTTSRSLSFWNSYSYNDSSWAPPNCSLYQHTKSAQKKVPNMSFLVPPGAHPLWKKGIRLAHVIWTRYCVELKQDRQCTHNVTQWRVRVTHCCWKHALFITYSECVSVDSVIQHAMRMRRIISSYVACPAVQYCSH
jgi:hypothetical protein